MAREFALFWEAGDCPFPYDPNHPYPIQDLVGLINQALRQENADNQLSAKYKYVCGRPDLFTASDRAFLEDNGFRFFDTEERNIDCCFVDENGHVCGARIHTAVPPREDVPYERKSDIAAGDLIDLMLMETTLPGFPKSVLLLSGNSDLSLATRCLVDRGLTVFVAKKPNRDGNIFHRRFAASGESVTFNWELMLCGGGRLYPVGPSEWKVQGVDEEVVPWVAL